MKKFTNARGGVFYSSWAKGQKVMSEVDSAVYPQEPSVFIVRNKINMTVYIVKHVESI